MQVTLLGKDPFPIRPHSQVPGGSVFCGDTGQPTAGMLLSMNGMGTPSARVLVPSPALHTWDLPRAGLQPSPSPPVCLLAGLGFCLSH